MQHKSAMRPSIVRDANERVNRLDSICAVGHYWCHNLKREYK
jgi:hypothetical protein